MRTLLLLFLCVVGIPLLSRAELKPEAEPLHLTLKLKDGSVLLGQISASTFQLKSEALGVLELPLARVSNIKFGVKDKDDTVTLANGDKVRGQLQFQKVALEMLIGPVSVSKELITEMQVSVGGSGKSMHFEWAFAPFPRNSDWPGDRGQAAILDDDGSIMLRGQPIYTKETYSLPLTIECDVVCPRGTESDGSFNISLHSPEDPMDMNPTDYIGFSLGYRDVRRMAGHIYSTSSRNPMIFDENFGPLNAGQTYHLRLELTPEMSQLIVDDKKAENNRTVIPYEKFRVRLFGWRSTDHWQIKNFTIH